MTLARLYPRRARTMRSNSIELTALSGDERRRATLEALDRRQNQRRLIAPAESINALTVGATHVPP